MPPSRMAPFGVAFPEDAETLHVGCHLGIARALGAEVHCRADAVGLEPRERLGEPFELREVAELHGGACELRDPALVCVRKVPRSSQREAAHERLAPVAEPQAIARDVPGGMPGEGEYPVVPSGLGGVVLDLHAQALEEPPELVLAPRDGAAPVLGEVVVGALAGRVAGYGLQERPRVPPTGRAGVTRPSRARVRIARPPSCAGAQVGVPPRRAPPGRLRCPLPLA